jgi:hypothetical protein
MVPLNENSPLLGLPALTAPFVPGNWMVQALVLLEGRCRGRERRRRVDTG